MATLPSWAFASGASTDSKEGGSPRRHGAHGERHQIERNRYFRIIAFLLRVLRASVVNHSFQPWASRTATIVARMPFHVSGFIIVSFGNMHPSQQMCRNFRVGLP